MALTINDFAKVANRDGFVKLNTFSEGLTRYGDASFGKAAAQLFRGPSASRLTEVRTDLLKAIRLEFGSKAAELVRATLLGGDNATKPLSTQTVREVLLDAAKEFNKASKSQTVDIGALKPYVALGIDASTAAAAVKGGISPEQVSGYLSYAQKSGISADALLSALSHKVPVENLKALHEQGLSTSYLIKAMENGISSDQISEYKSYGMSGNYAVTTLSADIDYGTMTSLMKDAGIDEKDFGTFIRFYSDYDLVMIPETMVKGLTDSNLEKIEFLGQGALNQVFKVEYKAQGDEAGKVGVFKPMRTPDPSREELAETGSVAQHIGIDRYNPQNIMRNIGTYQIAQLLGFDVVPKCEVSIHEVPEPKTKAQSEKPSRIISGTAIGITMELAKGVTGAELANGWDNTQFCRELVKLQLLDQLVGQGDRHANNYIVDVNPQTGKVKVTGIDNDQCFGSKIDHPEQMLNRKDGKGFRGVLMPLFVDNEMVAAFEKVTPESLEKILAGKLSPQEINAAKERLKVIKEHFEYLKAENRVIDANDWDKGDVMYNMRSGSTQSYYGRDYDLSRSDQTIGMRLNQLGL